MALRARRRVAIIEMEESGGKISQIRRWIPFGGGAKAVRENWNMSIPITSPTRRNTARISGLAYVDRPNGKDGYTFEEAGK